MDNDAGIQDFLAQKKIAVIGVSREGDKFSNLVYKNLRKKGYQVYPVNPKIKTIDGEPCYQSAAEIPEKVDGIVLVVPPEETEKVVRSLPDIGIKRVWMQPGAKSPEAVLFCEENGIAAVYDKCIMVLSKPLPT